MIKNNYSTNNKIILKLPNTTKHLGDKYKFIIIIGIDIPLVSIQYACHGINN